MFKEAIRQILYIPLVNLLILLIAIMPGHNAGLAIILLTIIIKLILLIPSRKAIQSQQRLKELQPQIDKIKRDFPNDRQKQSMEMMALYKRENVNMFGSCLPSLIQLPILLALYYAFRNGLDPARQKLLYDFIPHPDFIDKTFFGIDLTVPDHTYILPILAGIIQFIQTKMMMPKVTKENASDPNVAMQRNMVFMFPVLTVMISRSFAAALPLYWIISSLFSVVQQWLIVRKRPQTKSATVETHRGVSLSTQAEINISESKEIKSGIELTVRRKQ